MRRINDGFTAGSSNPKPVTYFAQLKVSKDIPDSLENNFIFIKSMYIFYVFNILATNAGFKKISLIQVAWCRLHI